MRYRSILSTLVPILGPFRTRVTRLLRRETADRRGDRISDETPRRPEPWLRPVFDSVADGIVAVDRAGAVRIANRVAERMLGRAPGALVGLDIRQLLAGIGDVDSEAGWQSERELAMLLADGSKTPVRARLGAAARDGGEVLRTISFREAGRPTPADRRREEFVSVVSHELRAPLSAILGSLSVIRGGAAGHVPPGMAPMIDMAQRNAERLVALVSDILDAERIEAGHLEIAVRPVDLNALVREAVEASRGFAIAKHLTLGLRTGDGPVPVAGDPRRLEQALANLLSNAAKFSDEGGKIDVAVDATGDRVRVTVSDSGPGIPPEFQPRVFDKFATRDAGDGRNRGGTGLGLGIAKALIEAHAGSIGFSSIPGDTRFWIELPLPTGPGRAGREVPSPDASGGRS